MPEFKNREEYEKWKADKIAAQKQKTANAGEVGHSSSFFDKYKLFLVGGAMVLVMVILFVTGPTVTSKPELSPQEAEKRQFSEQYSRIRDKAEDYIKKDLKDPDSYIFERLTFKDNGDGTLWAEIEYRAKNSFGGYTREMAIIKVDAKSGHIISGALFD